MKKSYTFIIRYNIYDVREDLEMGYLFADNYLIKLMEDYDAVYLGVETEISSGNRELFFRALDLNVTLSCLGEFAQQDEDFTKSYMKPPEEEGEGSLTMEYTSEPYRPFEKEELEYTKVSMEHDPRSTIKLIEDEYEMAMSMIDDDDDDVGENPGDDMEEMVKAIRKDPLVGRGSCTSIDETMEDDELEEELALDGITTVKDALKWAYDMEEMYLEQGLNRRWGDDDDPQLEAWREWKAARSGKGR